MADITTGHDSATRQIQAHPYPELLGQLSGPAAGPAAEGAKKVPHLTDVQRRTLSYELGMPANTSTPELLAGATQVNSYKTQAGLEAVWQKLSKGQHLAVDAPDSLREIWLDRFAQSPSLQRQTLGLPEKATGAQVETAGKKLTDAAIREDLHLPANARAVDVNRAILALNKRENLENTAANLGLKDPAHATEAQVNEELRQKFAYHLVDALWLGVPDGQTPFKVLGVPENASPQALEEAFNKAAQKQIHEAFPAYPADMSAREAATAINEAWGRKGLIVGDGMVDPDSSNYEDVLKSFHQLRDMQRA
jgi:hypothetical protein